MRVVMLGAPLASTVVWGALFPLLVGMVGGRSATPASTTTSTSINDIESFVKRLEYEAVNGGASVGDGTVVVNLNLLPDAIIADDVVDGVEAEFHTVDAEQGDTTLQETPVEKPKSRQLSLIYQGVYAPDSRFNAFVDGVMVNMVAEMKRKRMDPLYFRVYDRGIVEHVSVRAGREDSAVSSPADLLASDPASPADSINSKQPGRKGRDRGSAIGGGVIRGLTNVKRFGNAEVQIAGNTTLVRSHYVYGPLNIELLFHTEHGVKSINSTLSALAAHAVAHLNESSSKMIDFLIDSPQRYEINLVGERSARFTRLSNSAVTRLFKPSGRLEKRLFRVYRRARSRRIPNVKRQSRRRNRSRGRNRDGGDRGGEGNKGENGGNTGVSGGSQGETPELP